MIPLLQWSVLRLGDSTRGCIGPSDLLVAAWLRCPSTKWLNVPRLSRPPGYHVLFLKESLLSELP